MCMDLLSKNNVFKRAVLLIVLLVSLTASACSRNTLKTFFDGVENDADSTASYERSGIPVNQDSLTDTPRDSDLDMTVPVKNQHPDYQRKQCEKCHDVSHSNRLIQRQPELCYQCHKSYELKHKILHGPVAAGFCTACHAPHQSEHERLLKMPVREICQFCHHPGDISKNSAHQKISTETCLNCHDPHGGNTANLLIQ